MNIDQLIFFAKQSVDQNGRDIDHAYLSAMLELKQFRENPTREKAVVEMHIHPFLRERNCDDVIELLKNPPSAEKFDDQNDYYQHWWDKLIKAAKVK